MSCSWCTQHITGSSIKDLIATRFDYCSDECLQAWVQSTRGYREAKKDFQLVVKSREKV